MKLLAWAGADVNRCANGGASPFFCAARKDFEGRVGGKRGFVEDFFLLLICFL